MKKTPMIMIGIVMGCLSVAGCYSDWYISTKKCFGFSPDRKEFEQFCYERVLSRLSITYCYRPKNFQRQEITFKIEDLDVISKLQAAFKIKSISASTLGHEKQIDFSGLRGNDLITWAISFNMSCYEVSISYNNSKSGYTCYARLEDDSFYKMIRQLAYENNKIVVR